MNLDSFPAIIFKNCPIYDYTSCRNVVTVPLLSKRIPVFLFENVKPMTTTIIILMTIASFVFFYDHRIDKKEVAHHVLSVRTV